MKKQTLNINKYLYCYSYDNTESDLCRLESRYIFRKEDKNKLLFSDIKAEPSHSPFIKSRLEIISFSNEYADLIHEIKEERICIEDFKVEYLVFEGDPTSYQERLDKLKDIGYSIEGNPDYYKPTTTFALCNYEGTWCFGLLTKDKYVWREHNKKPSSYSNSISINIAKALVNIAIDSNQEKKVLDACCGVGTIMLEGCFAGIDIEGCDVNWKLCKAARENLSHYNYTANVYRSDIKDIRNRYDAAIIDLPYNLMSSATDSDLDHIIQSTCKVTNRIVVVSTTDISDLISKSGMKILDHCNVSKKGKTSFARKIWVCESELFKD